MRDFRKQVVFFCAHDGAYMGLVRGKYGLYYKCDKYFFENRIPGERVCTNYISLRDQESLYAELEWLEEEKMLKVGTTGKVGSVKYKITDIDDMIIRLAVENIKKKRKKEEG